MKLRDHYADVALRWWLVVVGLIASTVSADAAGPSLDLGQWTVLDINASQPVTLRIQVNNDGPAVAVAYAYVAGSFSHGVRAFSPGEDLHAEFLGPETNVSNLVDLPDTDGPGIVAAVSLVPGASRVVLASYGAIASQTLLLPTEANAIVLAEGPTFATDGSALQGGRWIGAGVQGMNVHAHKSRTMEFDIEGTLIGWFADGPSTVYQSVQTATLSGPAGIDTCPCRPTQLSGPNARGAGHYAFQWDGVGAGASHAPLVAWADVSI